MIIVGRNAWQSPKFRARVDGIAGGNIMRATEISSMQVKAHALLEKNSENKNLSCLGTTPEAKAQTLERLLTILDNGGNISKRDQKCLEKVDDGPFSFTKIVKKRFSSISFHHPSTLCGSVIYEPRKYVGGTTISVPQSCQQPVTLQVSGTYSQKFSDGRFGINPKTGKHLANPMLKKELSIMPIQNRRMYGILLIDGDPIDSKKSYKANKLNVNLNVSQALYGYRDLEGVLRIDFYN
jgi:hypothetical protein